METVWVQLKGLGKVAQQYGLEASETQEAIKIVKNMMEQLEDALQAADGDKVSFGCIILLKQGVTIFFYLV